jgi:subtilisin-like proprotein convertase family protein
VNGEWFLTVIDTASGNVGTLEGWSLELTSRWD